MPKSSRRLSPAEIIQFFSEDPEIHGCLRVWATCVIEARKAGKPVQPYDEAILRTLKRILNEIETTLVGEGGETFRPLTLLADEEHG